MQTTISDLLSARVAEIVSCATAQAHAAGDRLLVDSLLDFRYAISGGDPEVVVRSFMKLRPLLERYDFMAAFRLRRRLESRYRLQVTVPGAPPTHHLLDLRWRTWPLLVGSAKRSVFEGTRGGSAETADLLRATSCRVVAN